MTQMKTNEPLMLRRSVLSVPASNSRALAKLSSLDFDAVIFDLEDSVLSEAKSEARRQLIDFMKANPMTGRARIIRINDIGSEWFAEDIAAVFEACPDAVLVPKVNDPRDLDFVIDSFAETEAPDSMKLWAMIETPLAILNAAAIAEAGRAFRLECMVIGLNDLRKATHVTSLPGRLHVQPWLMQVVLAARAYNLAVIDSVNNNFTDLAAFDRECAQGHAMGFDGKMLIHPAQIAAANQHFGPSFEQITEATAIITAFDQPQADGKGAININGRMVERLHLDEARALIATVETISSKGKTS